MTSISTALPGAGGNAETTSSKLVRATSPAKSRLTIRLPDLNNARPALAAQAGQAKSFSSASSAPTSEPAETLKHGQSGQAAVDTMQSPAWFRRLPKRTLDFVRQPKFWLACVVAVAVQVVLAFVMTPAEGVSDGKKPTPGPAEAWQKAAEEPAARIVVPAAPVTVPDDHADAAPVLTTPMGPALPIEATSGATGPGSELLSAEPQEQSPAERLAAEHLPAAAGARVAGRPAVQTDGATLGGIAPLDADLPPAKHETR